jgi:hypothetical protein
MQTFITEKAPRFHRMVVSAFLRRASYWRDLSSFTKNPNFDLEKADRIYDRFALVINRYVK